MPRTRQRLRSRDLKFLVLTVVMAALVFRQQRQNLVVRHPHESQASSGVQHVIHMKTRGTRCPTRSLEELRPSLKSQFGEDEILLGWFNGICGGTYLEMGAMDGRTFSNSYVFHEAFGWKGLLIEAEPDNFQKLMKNRQNELATVQAAVCAERQTVHYVKRGIWEFAAPNSKQFFWKDVNLNQTIPIQCYRLRDILEEHVGAPFYFDFFSLDVEGAELEVLKSVDFTKVSFGIVLAKADPHNPSKNAAVQGLLESNGYIFLQDVKDRTNNNDWFQNKDHSKIYEELFKEQENIHIATF